MGRKRKNGMSEEKRNIKTVYHAPDEQTALACLDEVRTAWETKYPGSMKRWSANWDCISPMFKFSQTARKVMYTTNAIESLQATPYRTAAHQGMPFPPSALANFLTCNQQACEICKHI